MITTHDNAKRFALALIESGIWFLCEPQSENLCNFTTKPQEEDRARGIANQLAISIAAKVIPIRNAQQMDLEEFVSPQAKEVLQCFKTS